MNTAAVETGYVDFGHEPSARGRDDTLAAIREVWPHASAETTARLAQAATLVHSAAGTLMHEAELPPRVALVLDGTLAVVWNSVDGRRAYSGLMGPREFVGLTTVNGGPIPGDVDALTDVTVLTWPTKEFVEIAVSDREMTVDLLRRSVHAIQTTIYLLKVRTFTTAASRLAGLLLRFEPYCFGAAPAVSRGQLGDLAGVTVRMVSSIIRHWEADGIVRRVGLSGLELIDRDALKAKAAPFNDFPLPDPPIRGAALATRLG